MILPSDPLVVLQPGFRSNPVSDSSTWVRRRKKRHENLQHIDHHYHVELRDKDYQHI
jgi:hypothetical protein